MEHRSLSDDPQKTRILTSCNGKSMIADLKLEDTIAEFSGEKPKTKGATPAPVELTLGIVLLGTPVGSAEFANAFYANIRKAIMFHTGPNICDLRSTKLLSTGRNECEGEV